MSITRRKLNYVSIVAALLLMSLLVWQTSSAAFTANTDEDVTVSAGNITLTDNDAVSVGFAPVLFPGQSDSACVTVTYDQTPATPLATLDPVKVYGSYTDGSPVLSGDVEIEVQEGCGGSAILGFDTVANVFTSATDYASGSGTWVPASDGDSQDYQVTFTLPADTGDSAQDGSVDVTLTWEIQTTP